MAVTFQSFTGPFNRSTGSTVSLTYPASIAAGNLIVVGVTGIIGTYDLNVNGFTLLNSQSRGADRESEVWYKVATGSESGSFTLTGPGNNAFTALMARYSNATGLWSLGSSIGEGASATTHSIVGGTNPDISAGDHLFASLAFYTGSGNATISGASGQALSATGCTFINENEMGDGTNTSGGDVSYVFTRHECSAGPASSVPTYSLTIGAAHPSAMVLARIREDAAPAANPRANLMLTGVGF